MIEGLLSHQFPLHPLLPLQVARHVPSRVGLVPDAVLQANNKVIVGLQLPVVIESF